MTTPRFPDWQARLGALLAERRTMGFIWGKNDCCLFAADCVQACTGIDPAAGHRDYSDALGAARSLERFGGVPGVGDALAGEPIGPLMARVGDIGLVRHAGRNALVVCNGDNWLAVAEPCGLVTLPLRSATRAWRF